MSKNQTTMNLIVETLKTRADNRFTANELSRLMVESNADWAEKKRQKSKNETIKQGGFEELRAQVQSEIGSHREKIEKHPNLRMTEDRPRKYYYTKLSESEEVEAVEDESGSESNHLLTEHDLYPILADYLKDEFGVLAKRVDEKRSKNNKGSGGNRWL